MSTPVKTFSVTFCGGCNEAYERSAFVRDLLAEFSSIPGSPQRGHRDEEADIALLICGCHALCIAEREDCGRARLKRHVVGPDSLDYLHMPLSEVKQRLVDEFRTLSDGCRQCSQRL